MLSFYMQGSHITFGIGGREHSIWENKHYKEYWENHNILKLGLDFRFYIKFVTKFNFCFAIPGNKVSYCIYTCSLLNIGV